METFDVLGIKVATVQIKDVLDMMEEWIANRRDSHYVCVTNVNNVMFSVKNRDYGIVLNSADLAVPDGMPLVWIGRSYGLPIKQRVYGPDLLLAFCELAEKRGYSSFFYGGAEGVPEKMVKNLKKKFPGLRVVGTYSPPFRPLTQGEDRDIVQMINGSSPDVLWVGLGCPKQEIWMYEHRDKIKVPVMVGVGAAFDFFAGRVRQAPKWMQNAGLEWLYRLIQEPKRLAGRYIIGNSLFLSYLVGEHLGLKGFNSQTFPTNQ